MSLETLLSRVKTSERFRLDLCYKVDKTIHRQNLLKKKKMVLYAILH